MDLFISDNFKNNICKWILFYPGVFLLISTISDSLARKTAIAVMLFFFATLILQGTVKDYILGAVIICFILVNAYRFGIRYIINQDFYGLILLLLVMHLFSDAKNCEKMLAYMTDIRVKNAFNLFFLVLIFGIITGSALKRTGGWGVSLPILYGPFSLPHSLSYMLIVIYCIAGIMLCKTKSKVYLIYMMLSVLCVVWTGVRSAFLGLAIILLIDFLRIPRNAKKLILIFAGVAVGLYLLLFTDILLNNPIMQKTINAMKGGSITNSRGDFFSYLSNIYLHKTTLIEKIFGISVTGIRTWMYLRHATALHAHNDVMNTLLGMGIVGFGLFISLLIKFCKACKIWIIPFLVIFCLAFTNGLYMYISFVPCIPFIVSYYGCIYGFFKNE